MGAKCSWIVFMDSSIEVSLGTFREQVKFAHAHLELHSLSPPFKESGLSSLLSSVCSDSSNILVVTYCRLVLFVH